MSSHYRRREGYRNAGMDNATRRAARGPLVENLEGRQLLASATLSSGTLTVTGDTYKANWLYVEPVSSTSIKAKFNGTTQYFSRSAVTKVVVRGGNYNDYVGINTGLTVPAQVYGGSGADTVWSGGGNDSLYGGSGNDLLNGRGGDDYLQGDDGNDTLDGGAGTDRWSGGSGTNVTRYVESQSGTTSGGTGGSTGSGTTNPPTQPNEPTGSLPGNGSGSTPDAVISFASATTVPAGNAVHVNALSSTLNGGSPLTAHYQWDFGDSNGKYNRLVGFSAAHQYDRAGTYTITLRVTNEGGKTDTTSRTVTITNSSRRVLYVSSAGSDSNNGLSQSAAVRTIGKARSLLNSYGRSNVEVLFRRGDTFYTGGMWDFTGSNAALGAYGSGNAPVIKWNGSRQNVPMLQVMGTNVSVQNLTFTTPWTDTDNYSMPDAMNVAGRNVVINGCSFLSVGTAINTNQNPVGVLVQDSRAPSDTGVRSYFAWVQGSDHVYLGNYVANSTREAPLRIWNGAKRVLLYNNELINKSRVSAGDRSDTAKNSLTAQWGDYVYVSGNKLRRGPVRVGPLGDGDGYQWKYARSNYAVFENNLFDAPAFVEHGASHVMYRNNVSLAHGMPAYSIDGYDSSYARGVTNVILANNTAVNGQARGQFLNVGGSVNGITLVNNLYSAPNLQPGAFESAPVYVNGSNLGSFRTVANNVWARGSPLDYAQGGMNYVWSYWSDSRGYQTPAEWNAIAQVGTDVFGHVAIDSRHAPGSSSLADDGARLFGGVFTDYYGKVRPLSGAWTAGAVQI